MIQDQEQAWSFGGRTLEPLPPGLAFSAPDAAKTYLLTRFPDHEAYAPELIARLTELAATPPFSTQYGRHLGGTKLYDPASWGPAGAFLNARVAAYGQHVTRRPVRIEIGWANLYRAGDYIVPHSHTQAEFSLVYMLDPGDADPDNPVSGSFNFVDPRRELCCQLEPGRMTNFIGPPMEPGTLLIFPSELVHFVHPYSGRRPRITLSWNLRVG